MQLLFVDYCKLPTSSIFLIGGGSDGCLHWCKPIWIYCEFATWAGQLVPYPLWYGIGFYGWWLVPFPTRLPDLLFAVCKDSDYFDIKSCLDWLLRRWSPCWGRLIAIIIFSVIFILRHILELLSLTPPFIKVLSIGSINLFLDAAQRCFESVSWCTR